MGTGGLNALKLVEELQDVFASRRTRSLEWRVDQLQGILRFLQEQEQEIYEVLKKDLRKPSFECFTSEVGMSRITADNAIKSLPKWMKPEKVGTSSLVFPAQARIVPEPFGVCLIIGTWNFPFVTCLEPLIGALAAGNCVVLKPSEVAQHTSAMLAKHLLKYLDSAAVKVVEGGIPEATELLAQKWDKIFYTGNTHVGRIVMAAAAKNLTPVTLELGGKSPTLVDSSADLEITARRIAWGKWATNNGQACISPDYILVEESVAPKLVSTLKDTIKAFYGENLQLAEVSRVINQRHFERLMTMLKDEKTWPKVVFGGDTDEKDLYISPTIVLDPPHDSPIMQEEIFGPLLPIITVTDMNEAIKFVNSRPKPLALYIFSKNQKVVDKVIDETSSGGVTVNDTILHIGTAGLPFGGVGESGMGAHHGVHSFNDFSHKKGVLYKSFRLDNAVRYPPYTSTKQKLIRSLMALDFMGLLRTLFGLK